MLSWDWRKLLAAAAACCCEEVAEGEDEELFEEELDRLAVADKATPAAVGLVTEGLRLCCCSCCWAASDKAAALLPAFANSSNIVIGIGFLNVKDLHFLLLSHST